MKFPLSHLYTTSHQKRLSGRGVSEQTRCRRGLLSKSCPKVYIAVTNISVSRELQQNARENPIQASAAATGGQNVENLLDIDFDGAAPASAANQTGGGLESLVSDTPIRVASPVSPTTGPSNTMDDLMGLFGGNGGGNNGFEGLSLGGGPQPQQQKKSTNEDILGLF